MKKLVLISALCLISSCSMFSSPVPQGENFVVTTASHVNAEILKDPNEAVVIEFNGLPQDIQDTINRSLPQGEVLVATKEKNLDSVDAPRIPLQSKDGQTIGETLQDPSVWNTILAGAEFLLTTLVPGAAGLWATLGLMFKRSRDHMVNSAKSLATLDLKNTVVSLGKAAGFKHTESDSMKLNG